MGGTFQSTISRKPGIRLMFALFMGAALGIVLFLLSDNPHMSRLQAAAFSAGVFLLYSEFTGPLAALIEKENPSRWVRIFPNVYFSLYLIFLLFLVLYDGGGISEYAPSMIFQFFAMLGVMSLFDALPGNTQFQQRAFDENRFDLSKPIIQRPLLKYVFYSAPAQCVLLLLVCGLAGGGVIYVFCAAAIIPFLPHAYPYRKFDSLKEKLFNRLPAPLGALLVIWALLCNLG